ncbi:Protein kinase superfamily protein [Striga hermonthica]|uniref:Protein kinase superfamily protein n=1 Tax=Striga hermonthica TaxID=68872 RepID=A0A9N7MDZ8_STRHE|nr:Protein kinase superfamily protein [Striga hermonthica]
MYSLVRTRKSRKFQVNVQQTELPAQVGINGRAGKMVPTTDIRNIKSSSNSNAPKTVNGSSKNVAGIGIVNGKDLVKRSPALPPSKANKLPPLDMPKVLPLDESFSWANENYNNIQRTVDVWSFVLTLRVRVLLDNAKWAYIGSFSEEKQRERRRQTASWLRESVKINQLDTIDARGYNRSNISSRAIEAYLIQILKTGFFHADPHPGNLAIDVDEALIYYDFGMMGDIKSFTRERMLEVFYAVYEKDAKKVMQGLIDLGALQPTGDMTSVRRSVQFFLDNLLNQRPDQQQTLSAIGEDLFAIATDQPFRFPSTFTFVLRAFSTLEGIGYTLDPKFSFPKIAAPYAQELLDLRQQRPSGTQLVQTLRKQADDARSSTISMPYRVQRIEDIMKQLESGDLKLRVRVLESERAARKATILQMATIYTVFGGTLLNLGVTFSNQGNQVIGNGSFVAAGVFLTLFARSMQRVKNIDKFEKMI